MNNDTMNKDEMAVYDMIAARGDAGCTLGEIAKRYGVVVTHTAIAMLKRRFELHQEGARFYAAS